MIICMLRWHLEMYECSDACCEVMNVSAAECKSSLYFLFKIACEARVRALYSKHALKVFIN
jgi:hypothetical protein